MSLRDATLRFFDEHALGRPRLLAAVSGGADSVALLLTLHELGFDLVAGHVNHHLRGAESDGDEQFVRDLCAKLGVALLIGDGSLSPESIRHHGIEAAAREVRYARLHELRERCGAAYIATAHQQNDQAETVLMRRMTGSGIAGQRGIHPVRDDGVIRPLLEVPRAEIECFLRERDIRARHDSSNDDPRFLRNVVRHELLDPAKIAELANTASAAQTVWSESERRLDEADDTDCSPNATIFHSLPDDRALRASLLMRHIRRLDPTSRDVTAATLARLAETLDQMRRVRITKHLELIRRNNVLVLQKEGGLPARPLPFELPITPNTPAHITTINTTIHLRPITDETIGTREHQRFQLPINGTDQLLVRNRRPGDRFQPLGLPFHKKLKDFFIDRKIAAETRDHIPLIVSNGEVVCVVGVEISERFRITSDPGRRYEVWVEHESH